MKTVAIPELAGFSEFGRLAGFRPSYITQLKKDGRLVLSDDGKRVRVAESLRRINGEGKAGVAAHHAARRDLADHTQPPDAESPHRRAAGDVGQTKSVAGSNREHGSNHRVIRLEAIVAAAKIFEAAFQSARLVGMPIANARDHATALAKHYTGISWMGEFVARSKNAETQNRGAGANDFSERERALAWLSDRSEANIDEILAGIGAPAGDSVARRHIALLLSELRWSKARPRSNHGRFVYSRPMADA